MKNHALPQHNFHFVLDSIIVYRIEFSFKTLSVFWQFCCCCYSFILLIPFHFHWNWNPFDMVVSFQCCTFSDIYWFICINRLELSEGNKWKIRRLTLLVFNTLGNHDIITFGPTCYYIAFLLLLLPDRVAFHLFSSIDIIRCSILIICRFKWNIHYIVLNDCIVELSTFHWNEEMNY